MNSGKPTGSKKWGVATGNTFSARGNGANLSLDMANTIKLNEVSDAESADETALDDASLKAAGSIVAALFKGQARRVRGFLRWRLRSEEDAKDASQEVFLKLWRREKEGTLDAQAGAYLGSAVHHTAIDIDRARAYRRPMDHVSIDDVDVASTAAEPSEAAFWRDALGHFTDVLNEMPDLTQRIFVLYHVEGRPRLAIAKQLGITLRTVERHMARALAHCEARMKDYL